MAVNLSKVITRIKMTLGIFGITLPVDNIDEMIKEILEIITIPTYSIYQPHYEKVVITTDKLVEIKEQGEHNGYNKSKYMLPGYMCNRLLSIADVSYADTTSMSYAGFGSFSAGTFLPYGNMSMAQQLMIGNLQSNMFGTMYPRLTYEYEHPATFITYNQLISDTLQLTLAYEHAPSLVTLPPTALDSFMQLATLDCQANLYQIAKRWGTIETAQGRIELMIDDWAGAADKRESLISEWANVYHLDIPGSIVYK